MRPQPVSAFAKKIRLSDNISLAQMERYYARDVVLECLRANGNNTKRNRELPNDFVFYYLLTLCLHRNVSQKEVLRRMSDGLDWFYGLVDVKITGRSGISQAKSRIKSNAMKAIFERCAKPVATPRSAGCFYGKHRIVVIDGTDIDLYDSKQNAEYFGKSSNQFGECGYPKARAVALIEAGTHSVFALNIGKYKVADDEAESLDGRKVGARKVKQIGEISLAMSLTHHLEPGMIVLADRLFMAFELFEKCRDTGAELLFRAREDRNLEKEQILPDGSYVSTIYDSRGGSKKSLKVRVIEFSLEVTLNGKQTGSSYRLLTTLMDHEAHPLDELAKLYKERWEVELMLDEVKNHLMEGDLLRGRTPELVKQEIYAMIMAYNAVRYAMHEAAQMAKIDIDQLSFTHSKNVVERYLPKFGSFPPSNHIAENAEGDSRGESCFKQGPHESADEEKTAKKILS